MKRLSSSIRCSCSLLAIAAALLSSPPASAQECAVDRDCAPFQVCETFEGQVCGRPDCAPGEVCEPDPGSCMSYEHAYCVSAPCASDADCPANSVCHARTYTECSASACPSDQMCPDVEPECVERTGDRVCTPHYELPCSADADCGPGFHCEEQESWWCSGSGAEMRPVPAPAPMPSPGSGAVPAPPTEPTDPMMMPPVDGGTPDPDFECHVEPSGTFACELQELPCNSDSDCPEGLECEASYTSGGCWVDTQGNMGCEEDTVGPSYCQPPGGHTSPPVTMPGSSSGAPGSDTGGGAVDAGVEQGTGTSPPGSNPGEPNGNDDSGERPDWNHRRFGCSTGGASSSDWLGLVGLIGLALARIRARIRA